MIVEIEPLVEALTHKKQVTLTYTKEKTAETVVHTGGLYEIDGSRNCLFLWDTSLNDHIRRFKLDNIISYEILDIDFIDNFGWGFKLNGQGV